LLVGKVALLNFSTKAPVREKGLLVGEAALLNYSTKPPQREKKATR